MTKELGSQTIKKRFVESIYNALLRSLADAHNEKYSSMFTVDGSSIMCELPSNFFRDATIPEGFKIEMKFIVKKV